MASIFGNWNVVQILGVGLSGLTLLLMVLAYQLLNKVIADPNPNKAKVSLVKWYMGVTIGVLIIVGIFSIPILSKNKDLSSENQGLDKTVKKLVEDSSKLASTNTALATANDIHLKIDKLSEAKSAVEVKDNLTAIQKVINSGQLSSTVTNVNPEVAKDVSAFKVQIDSAIKITDQHIQKKDTAKFVATIKSINNGISLKLKN